MKRACLGTVLDLSLPIGDQHSEALALGSGVVAAMRALEAAPRLRVEVALCGATANALLRWGEERPLQMLAERAAAGQVTFLATACHGAFLPLAPQREASRQLELSEQINREALGGAVYHAQRLFPPQLGYSRSVAELALGRGATAVLADAISWSGGAPLPRARHFVLRDKPRLHVFFVDRALSEAAMRGALHPEEVHRRIARRSAGYAVVRLAPRALAEAAPRYFDALASSSGLLPASLGDLLALFPEEEPVEPVASALGTDPGELASGVPFAKWSAPGNELHALLWQLAQLAWSEAERMEAAGSASPLYAALRARLDESLDCAAWRFASNKPERDLQRVRQGGVRLLETIRAGGVEVRPSVLAQAERAFARLEIRCSELALEHQAPG